MGLKTKSNLSQTPRACPLIKIVIVYINASIYIFMKYLSLENFFRYFSVILWLFPLFFKIKITFLLIWCYRSFRPLDCLLALEVHSAIYRWTNTSSGSKEKYCKLVEIVLNASVCRERGQRKKESISSYFPR